MWYLKILMVYILGVEFQKKNYQVFKKKNNKKKNWQKKELHGNITQEICKKCGKIYDRDFDVGTIGFKFTVN